MTTPTHGFLSSYFAEPPAGMTEISRVGWGAEKTLARDSINMFSQAGIPQLWLCGFNDEVPAIRQQIFTDTKNVKGPILQNGRVVGNLYEDDNAVYALLTGILPTDLSVSREDQTTSLFENIEAALQSVNMAFSNVVRTWLYMDNILEWYDPFNRARDAFFTSRKVFGGFVPASTGIGSSNIAGSAIAACAVAMIPKKEGIRFEMVDSPLQCSALDYKSSFSRAACIITPERETLLVSGTASIEPGGATAYVGDIEKQIALTMRVIAGILANRNMTFSDTVRGVAYIKIPEFNRAWEAWKTAYGLTDIPIDTVVADVCRDDLLFEVELDAVKEKA